MGLIDSIKELKFLLPYLAFMQVIGGLPFGVAIAIVTGEVMLFWIGPLTFLFGALLPILAIAVGFGVASLIEDPSDQSAGCRPEFSAYKAAGDWERDNSGGVGDR